MNYSSAEIMTYGGREISTISKRLYVILICVFTVTGIVMSAIAAFLTQDIKFEWYYFLIVLAVSLVGVKMAQRSKKPIISFFGFSLVAIPFGMMVGPIMAQYTEASIFSILLITALVVIALGVVGAFVKKSLAKWAPYLMVALIIGIVGYFIVPIGGLFGLPISGSLTVLDWLFVVVFGFLVVYDWNKAMRIAYTVDNSIDSALAIYLDFSNIYLRLLNQTGRRK